MAKTQAGRGIHGICTTGKNLVDALVKESDRDVGTIDALRRAGANLAKSAKDGQPAGFEMLILLALGNRCLKHSVRFRKMTRRPAACLCDVQGHLTLVPLVTGSFDRDGMWTAELYPDLCRDIWLGRTRRDIRDENCAAFRVVAFSSRLVTCLSIGTAESRAHPFVPQKLIGANPDELK